MKIQRRDALRILVGALGLATLSACSGVKPSAENPSAGTETMEASWHRTYDSLEAVLADTSLVITGTPLSQESVSGREDGIGSKNLTLTTFKVGQSVGKPVGDVKVLSTDGFSQDDAAYYKIGESYVVYLTPFEFHHGVKTGFFITVGQLAAYRIEGAMATRVTKRDALPPVASVAALLQEAKLALK